MLILVCPCESASHAWTGEARDAPAIRERLFSHMQANLTLASSPYFVGKGPHRTRKAKNGDCQDHNPAELAVP